MKNKIGTQRQLAKSELAEGEANSISTLEHMIEHELEGKIAKRDIPAITARLTQIAVSEQFSGPLPHPKHLREYEGILPGAAERIISMAEKNLEHNRNLAERGLDAEIEDTKRGMLCGALLFGLLIVCGFASLIITGSEIALAIFLGAAVIGGVTAFIKGRNGGH